MEMERSIDGKLDTRKHGSFEVLKYLFNSYVQHLFGKNLNSIIVLIFQGSYRRGCSRAPGHGNRRHHREKPSSETRRS